jgi:hypothetical protein
MAESVDFMDRLDRLEATVKQVTEVLVLQNERIEVGFGNVRDEMLGVRREMSVMRDEMRAMRTMIGSAADEARTTTASLRAEMHGTTASFREEMRAVRDETRAMREGLGERLDRLIAITLKERTTAVERFASIEDRLARLEGASAPK